MIAISACQKEFLLNGQDHHVLGSSAHDLLSANIYTSMTVEVGYMPGFAPNAAVLEELVLFLNTYLNKPGGIKVIQRQINSSGRVALTLKDLVQLEKQNRTAFSLGSTITVYILIADAKFADKDLLGISYWNTSICLFGKAIKERSGGFGQASMTRLMTTLMAHEFGHLLGLVGQGAPMQTPHRDPDHGAHCINPSCLMYYGIEIAENRSRTSLIPDLDAACKADLKANGGK